MIILCLLALLFLLGWKITLAIVVVIALINAGVKD